MSRYLSKRMLPWLVPALLATGGAVLAQQGNDSQEPPPAQEVITVPDPASFHPASRMRARYTIDAKRRDSNEDSEDALPRSREFLRIDSTYYVGWMFEGVYKFNHAADYLGYRNASIPLARALNLLERDYRRALARRSSDLLAIYPTLSYQQDYAKIAYSLMTCYSNMEETQAVYDLLMRARQWDFQLDLLEPFNYLAWTVHRNRFYTSARYAFLGNSIDENEALANRYLDSGMRQISRNARLNKYFFPDLEQQQRLSVYHYKSMLASYAFQIDTAERYFSLMRNTSVFPHNNYATFRLICGDFRQAESEYRMASAQESGDKRLKEWVYYTSILHIYKGAPAEGSALLRDMIRANGSTPGFGWYNLALARSMFYDGQIAESRRYAEKAAQFREVHIGTTLGQTHYDFSLQLNRLLQQQARIQMQRFEHRNWWYNPRVLAQITRLTLEQYMQQFLIINQFASNPERDRVIYKLFSTESTVSWDEVWYLIRDFSTRYFLDRFSHELRSDRRSEIARYFRLFVARLQMKQGDYRQARAQLDTILRAPGIDPDYEKLFLARVYEAQAECARELDDDTAAQLWRYRMYTAYPQLMPFSGQRMQFELQTTGLPDAQLMARLKDCNIDFEAPARQPAPRLLLAFRQQQGRRLLEFSVVDAAGYPVVQKQILAYTNSEQAARQLAYRIFNIGARQEQPQETPAERSQI